ncbi:bacillithiol transferase BstA [Hymenobacter busanensis]|uniref:Bacillithiol transferase BstA n=1 Tax=Hymenobacter busanensis TaxID=2607656 RepID=A0A7L4ZUY9_9BACT|nr:bacillithiol transferase BstA [Hymenobacter busanensis]KAA9339413.1 bacillithiol transferase BstA [Hymenobacter busanensis]QHJ06827.1 bacillithiol transferase BstA [Hymenobacter busanensis]
MTAATADDTLRFPIGHYTLPRQPLSADERAAYIQQLMRLPTELRQALDGLNEIQFDTPYRPGGWTVRQVLHHLPDSHLNSYVRFRLALTEDNPTIKPYDEAGWAQLPDVAIVPPDVSLILLDALHARWVVLCSQLTDEQWARTWYHPGMQQTVRLDQALVMYAWHGKHHVAHITSLRQRMGW